MGEERGGAQEEEGRFNFGSFTLPTAKKRKLRRGEKVGVAYGGQ